MDSVDPPPILLGGDCGKDLRNAFAVRTRGVYGSLMRRARSVSACRACGGAWLRVGCAPVRGPSRRFVGRGGDFNFRSSAFNGLSLWPLWPLWLDWIVTECHELLFILENTDEIARLDCHVTECEELLFIYIGDFTSNV